MQDIRAALPQRAGADAVAVHRDEPVIDAVAFVDLRDLPVARVLERIGLVKAEQLDQQAVEVLRSRADDDPVRVGLNAAERVQMRRDRLPQRRNAAARRIRHHLGALPGDRAAHQLRPRGKREVVRVGAVAREVGEILRRVRQRRRCGFCRLPRGAALQRSGKKSLARHGIQIAFRNQLRVCVLDRDDADAEILREAALRGQLRAGRDLAGNDVVADAPVQVDVQTLPLQIFERIGQHTPFCASFLTFLFSADSAVPIGSALL